jgi:hypothetical protein
MDLPSASLSPRSLSHALDPKDALLQLFELGHCHLVRLELQMVRTIMNRYSLKMRNGCVDQLIVKSTRKGVRLRLCLCQRNVHTALACQNGFQ